MRRRPILLLLAVVCLGFVVFCIAADSGHILKSTDTVCDSQKITSEEHKKAPPQYDAVVFYDNLISAFMAKYGEKDGQPAHYPDNYAGAYINDDGKLVIQVAASYDREMLNTDALKEYAGYVDLQKIKETDTGFKADSIDEILVFEETVFSLNELKAMLEISVDNVSKRFPVVGYYVDTFNNTINIIIEPV